MLLIACVLLFVTKQCGATLPEWQRDRVNALLQLIDLNHDGILSQSEIEAWVWKAGNMIRNRHITRTIITFDLDQDKRISKEEVIALQTSDEYKQELLKRFETADQNKDDFIDEAEVPYMLVPPALTEEELETASAALVDEHDLDKDGRISEAEFVESARQHYMETFNISDPSYAEEGLKRDFQVADVDRDGFLTATDLQFAIKSEQEESLLLGAYSDANQVATIANSILTAMGAGSGEITDTAGETDGAAVLKAASKLSNLGSVSDSYNIPLTSNDAEGTTVTGTPPPEPSSEKDLRSKALPISSAMEHVKLLLDSVLTDTGTMIRSPLTYQGLESVAQIPRGEVFPQENDDSSEDYDEENAQLGLQKEAMAELQKFAEEFNGELQFPFSPDDDAAYELSGDEEDVEEIEHVDHDEL